MIWVVKETLNSTVLLLLCNENRDGYVFAMRLLKHQTSTFAFSSGTRNYLINKDKEEADERRYRSHTMDDVVNIDNKEDQQQSAS
jgi:hypothetical protein